MGDYSVRDGHMADAGTRAPYPAEEPAGTQRSAFQFDQRQDSSSLPELLRELAHQGSHLAQQQTRLVEAEMHAAVTDLKESAEAFAGAAVVGIAALGVLLMAFSFLLGSVMPLWLGTMIVAIVSLIGAYALYATGKSKLQARPLTMDRTRHTIERAPAAMTGNETEMHNGR